MSCIFCLQTALDLTAPASDALLKNRKNAWIQLAGHKGSFAPAGPNTIWKKRMDKENYETKTYQALMAESMRDMIPAFHREVEFNGECILFLFLSHQFMIFFPCQCLVLMIKTSILENCYSTNLKIN